MPPPTRASNDNRPIDSAVQPCSPCHWFKLTLLPVDRAKPRPAWWPKPALKAYPGEPLTITLAGVAPAQKLDGSSCFEVKCLSAGNATVTFDRFYADVEAALASGRRF